MFTELKSKLNFLEVAEALLEQPLVKCGDVNVEPEDKTCPFCNHRDCFRLNEETQYFKCFSAGCEESGDIITLAQKLKGLETPVEAAKWLAQEYKISLPKKEANPLQEFFDFAANYYHQRFLDAPVSAALKGLTPLAYQKEVRKHSQESLENMEVGWSDGNLVTTALTLGFDPEIIKKSNLVNRAGKDFFPNGVFIYPHKVRGRTSHFTFKDPLKQKEFQLPHKASLNDYVWYNSDSLTVSGPVIIVEGENDLLAVLDAGWGGPVVATIGTLSRTQIEAFSTMFKGRDIITIYDSDEAGDGYRRKTQNNAEAFASLKQVKVEGAKDVDEYIKAGGSLKALIESATPAATQPETGVFIKDGCYYKKRFKDGEFIEERLSNFIIDLVYVYIKGGTREREIRVIRNDGFTSPNIFASSEAKISLKAFKLMVANAADGSFYGSENDMASIWDFIYSRGREQVIEVFDYCGRVREVKGWLFRNMLIPDEGAILHQSEDGIIWVKPGYGIKASAIESSHPHRSIPEIMSSTKEEAEELLGTFIHNFSRNFAIDGSRIGDVLTIAAYAWACAFSEELFEITHSFPLLYFWGQRSGGKSRILKWAQCFYGMPEFTKSAMTGTGSQVGWQRMMAYYSSLPMVIDEVRSMGSNIDEAQANVRNYFDRVGRIVASKENSNQIVCTPVRSTLILGGEDIFSDPATLQRCLPISIPKADSKKRDMTEAFQVLDKITPLMSKVGYYWLTHKNEVFTQEGLYKALYEFKSRFDGQPIESRTAFVWSTVGIFAEMLAAKYAPGFDYAAYSMENAVKEKDMQEEVGMVSNFFSTLARLQVTDPLKTTKDFVRVNDGKLYVWYSEFYDTYLASIKLNNGVTKFSKAAVRSALRECPFYVKYERKNMGNSNTSRWVEIFDIDSAPDYVKQVAQYYDSSL